ncbi:BPL-N domain-containing protein [Rhodococcus sp. X156]|uniref:BPL-N domain-containing protein n=1 Tax=Rhodococcus sp. X156 TaxID=2499145 RepID=UPI000FD715A4|nr:BPL-N domain-containing protein [Rhodococcus sp. X156]
MRRWLGRTSAEPEATRAGPDGAPLALVYRGPASVPGCSEAVAELLSASRWGFAVRYVGPHEPHPLSAATLAGAAVYAQPGGADLGPAYRRLRKHRHDIRGYVQGGGRYLGFCLGGYLAGATPGFKLLPGDTDQYVVSRGATVRTTDDTLVEVCWGDDRRVLFFQDGPHFEISADEGTTVMATYPNGTVAALVTGYGAGRVGVVGPHPEATRDWFTDAGLPDPGRRRRDAAAARGQDLGLALVDAVMSP